MVGKWQRKYNLIVKSVKTFSGATVSCMEDCMKPTLRNPPDHFILHVRTSNLSFEKYSMEIAESIINLACRLKNETHNVSVSTIILRTDDKKSNEKMDGSKFTFKKLSKEKNIFLIDNSRKIKAQHLNEGKLYLTKYGSRILMKCLKFSINKLIEVIQTLKSVILKILLKNTMSAT